MSMIRNNGLSIVLTLLFAISLVGHSVAGVRHYNDELRMHQQPAVTYGEYVRSSEFIESVFENWESEFLQMGLYVWLTSFLFQKGSAESKDPGKKEDVDEDPRQHRNAPGAPYAVKAGGLLLKLYEQSLVIALLLLFVLSFGLHLIGTTGENCREQALHGHSCEGVFATLQDSTFWFESFQNWQSEFLSIAAIVVLSIFLRQKGSPESKPVHAAHGETGK